jgi:hypothetical protein
MKNATATSQGSSRLLATEWPGESASLPEEPDEIISSIRPRQRFQPKSRDNRIAVLHLAGRQFASSTLTSAPVFGTVRDSSGAIVQGANVNIRHSQTDAISTTKLAQSDRNARDLASTHAMDCFEPGRAFSRCLKRDPQYKGSKCPRLPILNVLDATLTFQPNRRRPSARSAPIRPPVHFMSGTISRI